MRQSLLRSLAALALGLLVSLAPATSHAAPAPGGTPTQVAGLMTPDNPESPACTAVADALASFTVAGTLDGCWYVTSATKWQENGNGGLLATGTETFDGCLGQDCGQLFTTFTFTAQFADDGTELHGRCQHPIVGGTGDFAGASGVITMRDLPDGCSTYKGHVTY